MIEINVRIDTEKIERCRGRERLEICLNNKRVTQILISLIVKPNTTIVTNLWKS